MNLNELKIKVDQAMTDKIKFRDLSSKKIYGVQLVESGECGGCPLMISRELKGWIKPPENCRNLEEYTEELLGSFIINESQSHYYDLLKNGVFKGLFKGITKKNPIPQIFLNYKEGNKQTETIKIILFRYIWEFPSIPASVFYYSKFLGLSNKTSLILGLFYQPLNFDVKNPTVAKNIFYSAHSLALIPKFGERINHFLEMMKDDPILRYSSDYLKYHCKGHELIPPIHCDIKDACNYLGVEYV